MYNSIINSDRPETTLFMIESLDGKISTGDTNELDVDKDFKRIVGVKEGLQQYYELEKLTDPFSLNTGKVMAKIGVNTRQNPTKIGCSFIIIDSKPHLNVQGVDYLARWVKKLFLVTINKAHPAFEMAEQHENIEIIYYENKIDLSDLLKKLKEKYQIEKLTIQSGGTLNSYWIRKGLVDHVSIVIAPCLIGGKTTPTLLDGESLHEQSELKNVKALNLVESNVLENSYLHLKYEVISKTIVEN